MNRNIWLISDTHLNHNNIIKYCNRPFSNPKEMNECIQSNWNETIKDGDIVYHLGDVYMGAYPDENYSTERFLSSLKGRKRLILGNHDNGKDQILQNTFQKISIWRMFVEHGLMLTHVPIHPGSFRHKCSVNVHGHTHDKDVLNEDGTKDDRYVNVCVDKTNFYPINIDSLKVV
jgi:calcineurin-like phosphoesterase family protein